MHNRPLPRYMRGIRVKSRSLRFSVVIVAAMMLAACALSLSIHQATSRQQPDIGIISAGTGDVVHFDGKGTPNSRVMIEVTSTVSISAGANGRYAVGINNVQIPDGENRFSVSAYPVTTMTVAGNSQGSKGISAVEAVDVVGGRGSLSVSNVPADKYNIMVYGTAKDGEVSLDVTASCAVSVDKKGRYSANVNTRGMPAGVYTVKQDGVVIAVVYLGVPVN